MFLDYYNLREQPFEAASHPAQVYPSQSYCEALESLSESILSNRGSLTLIAESGLGKTTLLLQLLEGVRESGRSAALFQKQCSSQDILHYLLSETGFHAAGMDPQAMQSKLNGLWFAELLAGRKFVLLLDDAEDLDESVLRTLQSISKYETPTSKFVQMVLCGQPKFLETLQRDNLAALRKRITQTMQIEPLTPMETAGYIRHRLRVAGYHGDSLFTPEALAVIADYSRGIFRNINRICSRALLEAYARGLRTISDDIIEKADRHLNSAAGTPAVSRTAASPVTNGANPSAEGFPSPFKPKEQFSLPGAGLWAGAIVGILLSAGLALPNGMLRGMTHRITGGRTATASLVEHAPAPQPAPGSTTPNPPKRAPNADPTKAATLSPSNTRAESQSSLTRELGLKINRIVIDAGHGGWDTGAKGPHGLMEKDVCLDVALRLGQLIGQNIPGAEVVYTRKDDTFIPLEERTAIANNSGADLFISIHANSSESSEVRGVETYYLSLATSKETKDLAMRENALTQSSMHDLPDLLKKIASNEKISESRELATDVQYTLSERLQVVSLREKNRGVKQAPFLVLTGANMPAILSEISFVTNSSDEILLSGDSQRQRIADGLYRGISAYLNGLGSSPQEKQKLLTLVHAAPVEQAKIDGGRKPL